jgi:antitoxin VapB
VPRQLNIRSDEAYRLASELARRTGRTRADVVLAALLIYREAKTGRKLTGKQRAFVDELMALARRSAAAAGPKASSDHSHFYDESGLPR